MPSPVSFSKDRILDEAFNILRKEGLQELSVRKIARNLGCSTQPVYSTFGSMQKLQDEALKKARKYAIDYLLQGNNSDEQSLAMGMQYFRFSREERVLFKILFLEGEMAMTLETMSKFSAPLVERMKQDKFIKGLSEDRIKRIGRDMWVYTHGLVSFVYNVKKKDLEKSVLAQLLQMGETVIGWERYQAGLSRIKKNKK
ncbi:MAG: TetR/AcrR family transcriptional regulator [Ignavibacteria bacterium]|jgi:AcrR family transcriptional regulator